MSHTSNKKRRLVALREVWRFYCCNCLMVKRKDVTSRDWQHQILPHIMARRKDVVPCC